MNEPAGPIHDCRGDDDVLGLGPVDVVTSREGDGGKDCGAEREVAAEGAGLVGPKGLDGSAEFGLAGPAGWAT